MKTAPNKKEIIPNNLKNSQNYIKCIYCGSQYYNVYRFEAHIRIHVSKLIYLIYSSKTSSLISLQILFNFSADIFPFLISIISNFSETGKYFNTSISFSLNYSDLYQ